MKSRITALAAQLRALPAISKAFELNVVRRDSR